jgi:hypothetical protein
VNYFNYFTEIEEHFQQARATGMFLLSPLDWALVETWKESGIPLEAVHKGIDRAFEKWHARKRKTRMVNSLAYCAQEVLTAARETADVTGGETPPASKREPVFSGPELAVYFGRNVAAIRTAAAKASPAVARICRETITSLEKLIEAAVEGRLPDLEAVEQRLTVLEERLIAALRQQLSEEEMLTARQSMERELAPYRNKMTADQLVLLEKQYLDRRSLEAAGLPRLSLFYL